MRKVRDRTGQRINHFVVQSYAGIITLNNGNTEALWNCLCDCGKHFVLPAGLIRNGDKQQSCGCKRGKREFTRRYSKAFNVKYDNLINNAKARDLECLITREEFYQLSVQPCYYCGLNDDSVRGLDRFDNSIGYYLDNVVPCCKHCNVAKNALSYEDFTNLVKRIYENLNLSDD